MAIIRDYAAWDRVLYSDIPSPVTTDTPPLPTPEVATTTAATTVPKYFKFMIIHDTKDNTSNYYYLQYTGNEAEMDIFWEAIKNSAYSDRCGDFAWAEEYDSLISESAVNEHSRMFRKCTGVFISPITREAIDECYAKSETADNAHSSYMLTELIDEALWHKSPARYFK